MRALIRFIGAFVAFFFVFMLASTKAALAADALAAVSGHTPQTLLGLVSLLGVGLVVQLSARDREGNRQRFRLDSDSEQFAENLEDYVEAKQDEVRRPLQAQLTAMTEARDVIRDMVIGEIVRVESLRHGELVDKGEAKGDFDAEEHTAYLTTLTPDMLKLHYKRAASANVTVTQKTSGEGPGNEAQLGADTGDEIPFGTVTSA
ncbi:MAG: hypothetical protein AAGF99_05180 [Bacteroidota bacterium]